MALHKTCQALSTRASFGICDTVDTGRAPVSLKGPNGGMVALARGMFEINRKADVAEVADERSEPAPGNDPSVAVAAARIEGPQSETPLRKARPRKFFARIDFALGCDIRMAEKGLVHELVSFLQLAKQPLQRRYLFFGKVAIAEFVTGVLQFNPD